MKNSNRYRDSSDFNVEIDGFGNNFFVSHNLGISLKIKDGGYVPKSGLLLANVLDLYHIQGKVLDIGTGEIGFLAYYLLASGANSIFATDIDENVVNHAKKTSQKSSCVKWIVSDVYENIKDSEFDLIVSNPPQMPCKNGNYNDHDFGGKDGRKVIMRIISDSSKYLAFGGRLIVLCFDFLGAERKFNNQKSIIEMGKDFGLRATVIGRYTRIIRTGGKTEDNLDWIRVVYPEYKFKKTPENNFSHEIIILEFTKG